MTWVAKDYRLVTLKVIYFLPDYSHLLQEFLWQVVDERPTYPRIVRFIDFWKRELLTPIKEIYLSDSHLLTPISFHKVDFLH